jgi:hypothetical protein
MRYVKLDMSFMDRVRFLCLGVIPEERLPEVVRLVDDRRIIERPPLVELSDEINTSEEDDAFVMPFFDLSDEETKSNF